MNCYIVSALGISGVIEHISSVAVAQSGPYFTLILLSDLNPKPVSVLKETRLRNLGGHT